MPSRLIAPISVTFALLLCSSCAKEPATKQALQGIDMPVQFSESGEYIRNSNWWQAFANTQLNALITKALTGNLEVQKKLTRVEQSRELARKAHASLIPGMTISSSATRNRQKADTAGNLTSALTTAGKVITVTKNYSLELATNYELDLWGKLRASRKSANYTWQASNQDYQSARLLIADQITKIWLRLLEGHSQLALLQQQLQTNKKFLKLIELRFSQGLAVAGDVYGQRQSLAAVRSRAPLIRSRIKVMEHQLSLLLGQTPQYKPQYLATSLPQLPPLPRLGIPAKLILKRPDVKAALLHIRVANQEATSAFADRFPAISINSFFSDSSTKTSTLFENWLLSLAGNLAFPLLDGGSRAAEVRRRQAILKERVLNCKEIILTALKEVEDALTRETEQQKHLELLQKQITAAKKTLGAARRDFINGLESYMQVLTALNSLQELEKNLILAKLNLLLYRVDLYKAVAGEIPDLTPKAEIITARRCNPQGLKHD